MTTVDHAVALLRARRAEAHRAGDARARTLTNALPRAARLLRARYGATTVLLFGSLATGGVTSRSDVDLLVSGLPSRRHFEAAADLAELFGCMVDLVRFEDAPDTLRERAAREGRAL